jgi:hypothetical protein
VDGHKVDAGRSGGWYAKLGEMQRGCRNSYSIHEDLSKRLWAKISGLWMTRMMSREKNRRKKETRGKKMGGGGAKARRKLYIESPRSGNVQFETKQMRRIIRCKETNKSRCCSYLLSSAESIDKILQEAVSAGAAAATTSDPVRARHIAM